MRKNTRQAAPFVFLIEWNGNYSRTLRYTARVARIQAPGFGLANLQRGNCLEYVDDKMNCYIYSDLKRNSRQSQEIWKTARIGI